MVQLPVDVTSDKHASDYRDELIDNGMLDGFKSKLEAIKEDFPEGGTTQLKIPKKYAGQISSTLENDDIRKYINLIKQDFEELLNDHPSELLTKIASFETIISRGRINRKIVIGGTEEDSLSSRIVDAMGYITIRDQVYPLYVKKLGIKTCVYCNANYAITDKDGNGYYELDHWKPKSLYPYLCVSFYNLQVSCPSCNRRKSDGDQYQFFQLWNDQTDKSTEVFKFGLNYANAARYWITHKSQSDYVKFQGAEQQYEQMSKDMNDRLHIEIRYREHNDMTEEVFWKAIAYNHSFFASLHGGLNQSRSDGAGLRTPSLPLSRGDMYRFILGCYQLPEEVHRRPLSKMIQDIAKALKIEI